MCAQAHITVLVIMPGYELVEWRKTSPYRGRPVPGVLSGSAEDTCKPNLKHIPISKLDPSWLYHPTLYSFQVLRWGNAIWYSSNLFTPSLLIQVQSTLYIHPLLCSILNFWQNLYPIIFSQDDIHEILPQV